MSSLNTIPKFFYDENFKLDSEYKIDYYELLYGSKTETKVSDKFIFIGITTPSDTTINDNNIIYTFLIGQGVKKYISSKSRLKT